MEELISIIVPVYNTESYLRQCLDSLRGQTHNKMEVILVDDGSQDRSGEICEEYSGKDRRFFTLHQKHAGALAARITGLRFARGAYVGFVDSDDWVDRNAYHEMYGRIKNSGAQMAVCMMNIWDEVLQSAGAVRSPVREGYYSSCRDKGILRNLFFKDGFAGDGLSLNLSDKLTERTLLLNNLEHVDSRLHYFEDISLALLCMMEAEGIEVCGQPFYYYRQRKDSLCHSSDPAYLEQVGIFYRSVYPAVRAYSPELLARLRAYVADRAVYGINHMMGLELLHELPYYLPPFGKIGAGERIALYGAGEVGKSYRRILELTRPGQVVLWADKRHVRLSEAGFAVVAPEALARSTYDRILIAVKYQSSAEMIKGELCSMGFAPGIILWEPPESVIGG